MQKGLSIFIGLLFTGALILASCASSTISPVSSKALRNGNEKISISHAKNFKISEVERGVYHLRITSSESKRGASYDYLLVNQNASPSDSILKATASSGYVRLNLPLNRFICMTSLQLSNFIALHATKQVVGITSTRHLHDDAMNANLSDGNTVQIGIEGNFDAEMIMAVSPDLILISPSKRGGFETFMESGIPFMPHLGYQELSPLGQAEWIKLVGLLSGHLPEANAYFNSIEKEYNHLCELVKENEKGEKNSKPTIMSGDMKGGAWYATGGRSFLAQIFRDAGARYFMENDKNTGGVNIDFEEVYAHGANADYWRISNSFDGEFTYEELAAQDVRFKDFKSFKNRNVVYCNMSKTPFYESFPVHPDLLLSDFIHVFHPELLPNYSPTYYKLLK